MTLPELTELRAKGASNSLQYAAHAITRMAQRSIVTAEVREVLANGQVLEDYPDDRYGPSCLIFGNTLGNRPLHIVCSYPQRPLLKIITVYEPDLTEWLPGFTQRKKL